MDLLADLTAEHADLDALVAPLDDAAWDRATPSEGWTIRDTVSHLAFFDEAATQAAGDPEGFRAGLPAVAADFEAFLASGPARGRALDPPGVLTWWRAAREESLRALAAVAPGTRVPWYGPDMS